MPLLTTIIARCRTCEESTEIDTPLITDPSRSLLAVHRDSAVTQLYERGWERREFPPAGKSKWPSGTGIWDWLCPFCRDAKHA